MVKTSDFESENSGLSPGEAAREIEKLRSLLREIVHSAWEMEFEDAHKVDSDCIGKAATYLMSLKEKSEASALPDDR